jgi:hypothetical protein
MCRKYIHVHDDSIQRHFASQGALNARYTGEALAAYFRAYLSYVGVARHLKSMCIVDPASFIHVHYGSSPREGCGPTLTQQIMKACYPKRYRNCKGSILLTYHFNVDRINPALFYVLQGLLFSAAPFAPEDSMTTNDFWLTLCGRGSNYKTVPNSYAEGESLK